MMIQFSYFFYIIWTLVSKRELTAHSVARYALSCFYAEAHRLSIYTDGSN